LERLVFEAYKEEVQRVDPRGHGIITATVRDIDTATDGLADRTRLYLPPTAFNRFAVTREINDGSLAPRFSPSQRGWVLSGSLVKVSPTMPPRDATWTIDSSAKPSEAPGYVAGYRDYANWRLPEAIRT
jgi:hypothetical protein